MGDKSLDNYLMENKKLKNLYLENNKIGNSGEKSLAQCICVNESLEVVSKLSITYEMSSYWKFSPKNSFQLS